MIKKKCWDRRFKFKGARCKKNTLYKMVFVYY